jgi:hypothetical protein
VPDELWTTAATLGAALRATPLVWRVCEPLASEQGVPPVNFRQPDGMNPLLMLFYQYLRTQPLLVGERLAETGAYDLDQPPSARAWLDDAVTVAATFQTMIELLRARLPGYPSLHVPHLRPGSPRLFESVVEFTGFPWDPALRRARLHRNPPPAFDELGGDHDACRELLLATASCLERRTSWQRFAAAQEALSEADVRMLIEGNKQFAARMRPQEVNLVTDRGVGADLRYREAVLHELIVSAEGAVGEYLEAFELVDQLITVIAAYLQALAIRAELPVVEPRRMDLEPHADLRPVELAGNDIKSSYGPTGVFYVRGPLPELSGIVYPFEVEFDELFYSQDDDREEQEPARSTMTVHGRLATGSG